jgi:hypothetical protein
MEKQQPMSDLLPQRINVMKVVTYDVAGIVQQLQDERDSEIIYDKDGSHRLSADEPFTIEQIIDRVESYVEDDFAGMRLSELVFQDEDGNDL